MKWYHWIGIAVAALLFWPRKAATGLSSAVQAVINEANANWPGGAGDPSKIHPADQSLYPGFYQNEYGGFYNPDTGDSYSPGSSPVVYMRTPEQIAAENALGEAQGVAINQAAADALERAKLMPESSPGYLVY